jgi:hypothetical protein
LMKTATSGKRAAHTFPFKSGHLLDSSDGHKTNVYAALNVMAELCAVALILGLLVCLDRISGEL